MVWTNHLSSKTLGALTQNTPFLLCPKNNVCFINAISCISKIYFTSKISNIRFYIFFSFEFLEKWNCSWPHSYHCAKRILSKLMPIKKNAFMKKSLLEQRNSFLCTTFFIKNGFEFFKLFKNLIKVRTDVRSCWRRISRCWCKNNRTRSKSCLLRYRNNYHCMSERNSYLANVRSYNVS